MMKEKNSREYPLFSNKKGNAAVIGIIALVVVGLIYFLITIGTQHFLLNEINGMVQEDGDFSAKAQSVTQTLTDNNNTAWDNGFALLVGGALIGLFIAGFTLENNPLILGVVFLLLILGAYAGMQIVNIYEEVNADTVDTLNFQVEFPKAHVIMSNLVVVLIAGITLLGLGIFTSSRVGL